MPFPFISPKQSFPDLEKFDIWNEEKKLITAKNSDNFYVNKKEIWYVKLGINIGSESNGKKYFRRPVLVLKKVWSMFFVAPLTTKWKENKFYYTLQNTTYTSAHFERDISRVQLSQVRMIDKKRFLHLLGTVSKEDFQEIKSLIIELIL